MHEYLGEDDDVIVVHDEEKCVEVDGIKVSREVLQFLTSPTAPDVWWRSFKSADGNIRLETLTLAEILATGVSNAGMVQ